MEKKNITDLQALRAEKQRLAAVIKAQEQQLKEQLHHLESDYPAIIWAQVNPFKKTDAAGIMKKVITGILPLAIGFAGKKYSIAGSLLVKTIGYPLVKSGFKLARKFLRKNKNGSGE